MVKLTLKIWPSVFQPLVRWYELLRASKWVLPLAPGREMQHLCDQVFARTFETEKLGQISGAEGCGSLIKPKHVICCSVVFRRDSRKRYYVRRHREKVKGQVSDKQTGRYKTS